MRRRGGGRRSVLVVVAVFGLGVGLASGPSGIADPATPAGLAPMSGSYVFNVTFDHTVRDYRLHVPPQAGAGRPLPLVLNLHGATQTAILQEGYSGMDASADQAGYLVAYPDGTLIGPVPKGQSAAEVGYGWNAGQCCGLPVTRRVDDVGFLLRVISDIAARTPVDPRRVYVTGMSNGGMMAYAMAAEASDHIAAIASVSGQVELPTIHPTRAVPTLEFHSVNDPIAKWGGVKATTPKLRLSVMEGIDQWVAADHCDPKPVDDPTIHGPPGTQAHESATLVTYRGCRPGSEVALWRFTGSGHVWPGSPLNTGAPATWVLAGVGQGTTLVNANQAMWDFFERYSLPTTPRP